MKLKAFQPYTKQLPIVVAVIVAVLNVLLGAKVINLNSHLTETLNGLLVAIGLTGLHVNGL